MIDIFFYCMLTLAVAVGLYSFSRNLGEFFACVMSGLVAAILVYFVSMLLQATSFEILSGEVTGKHWKYDPSEESYSCGRDGKDTCYREIPRWRWTVESNTGGDYYQYTYENDAPAVWTAAKKGQPFARTKMFLNFQYVHEQSVLFNQDVNYTGWLPSYPDVYGGFQIDRCLSNVLPCRGLNAKLSESHKIWGPKYKANILVVVVSDTSKGFANALRTHWTGGKKNDAVLVLYVDKTRHITDAEVFGRSTSEKRNADYSDFYLILREQAKRIGAYNEDGVIAALDSALPFFERDNLEQYNYMAYAYSPPAWLNAVHIVVILIVMAFAVTAYRRNNRYPFRRYRR